jgi:serine protease Do
LLFIAGLIVGFAIAAGASRSGSKIPVYLATNTPVTQNLSLSDGLNPVVQAVKNSVVSILSTKRVQARTSNPLFEDPFFRRFFGGPEQPREFLQQGLGSGVIVSPDGYILTNNHVVADTTELEVVLADRSQFKARVIGTDPKTDVAVAKIEATKLPAITLGDSSRARVGDFVVAIGNPFGLQLRQTVTFGIISATGRGNLGIADYGDFIQTDAAINPGNSGGALVNMHGEFIGINTAILGESGGNVGVGFAIPVNMARGVMDLILKQGKVVRGYLGVTIQDLNKPLADRFGVKDYEGALVSDVAPGGPADRAGLRTGDVIVEFNGEKITDSSHFRNKVAFTPPGTKATLKILRNGKEQTATVELGELKEKQSARSEQGTEPGAALSGIEVDELTPQIIRRYNLPRDLKGVIVTDIDPTSSAAQAGLRPGDVIREVNRQPMASVQDFRKAVSAIGNQGAILLVYFRRQGSNGYVTVEPKG